MPQLPNYTAKQSGAGVDSGRRATGADFGAEAGAALKGTLLQVGKELTAELEQEDNRRFLVGHAQLRQKYAKELEDAEVNGGDVDKIREKMDAEMADLRGTAKTVYGLQTADVHAANSLNAFDSKAAQVKATRAGAQARNEGFQFIGDNDKLLRTNPSALPMVENEAKAFAQTFKGRLTPAQIDALEAHIVQNANISALGALTRIMPEETKRRLEAGDFTLTPEQRIQEISRADQQMRADREAKEHAMRFADYEKQRNSQAARDDYTVQIFKGTFLPNGEALNDPRLTVQDREHLIVFNKTWWDSKRGEEKRSNPRVVHDLMLRVYAPDGDKTKIYTDTVLYEALKNGFLNPTDFNKLRVAVAEQRDPNNSTVGRMFYDMQNTLSRAFSLDPAYTAQPMRVAGIINGWSGAVRDKMDEARKAGTPPLELFDPKSPKYVGNPEFIAQFATAARPTDASVNASASTNLPEIGQVYQRKDGTTWRRLGLDVNDPKSWVEVPNFPVTPSGETPQAQRAREVEEQSRRYHEWMRGGGK